MRILDLILALLIVAVWGFNFVVIKVGLHEVPPLLLCSLRFLLTSFPAIFIFKRPAIPFKLLAAYGLTTFALQFGLLFAGIHAGVTPGLAALIIQTQVFFTVLFAAIFLDETINIFQILGMLIAFIGIGWVGVNLGDTVSLIGFLLVLAAGASWGTGNLLAKKIRSVNMFALVIWGNFIALPPTLISSLLLDGPTTIMSSLHHINGVTLLAILYLVYCSTMFGYGVWSKLLKHYPIATVAPYILLVPVLGFLSSAIALGEPLQSWKFVAAILVVAGLCVNFFGTLWLNKYRNPK